MDRDYRSYVGPPERYDLIAMQSFSLLGELGMRQHSNVLDVGAGSLRNGRLLIPLLDKKKYTGIEPNKWLIREGIKHEVGRSLVRIKRPRFLFQSDATNVGPSSIDFVLAQSIFSHTSSKLLRAWAEDISRVLKPGGRLLGTYFQGDRTVATKDWVYPRCTTFRPNDFSSILQDSGLAVRELPVKHPGRQTWFVASIIDPGEPPVNSR